MDQQSLLRWGIENAQPGSLLPLHEDIKAGRRPDLNTDMLKVLMGTSDADRMKECLEVIQGRWVDRDGGDRKDGEITPADRYRAWDDLEMLVEDLDNANDLKFLKLWTPIIKHLTDEDEEVAMRACWVCGTAVQNNPRAQEAFLELDPLPTILSLVGSTTNTAATRNKAMYCLSATLKHSPAAVVRFAELGGWATLNQALQDPSAVLRTKTAFLLSQLVLQSPSPSSVLPTFRRSFILPTLLMSLTPSSAVPTGPDGDDDRLDLDYREKALRVLVNVVAGAVVGAGGDGDRVGLRIEEKAMVRGVVKAVEQEKGFLVDDLGMTEDEWAAFKIVVGA